MCLLSFSMFACFWWEFQGFSLFNLDLWDYPRFFFTNLVSNNFLIPLISIVPTIWHHFLISLLQLFYCIQNSSFSMIVISHCRFHDHSINTTCGFSPTEQGHIPFGMADAVRTLNYHVLVACSRGHLPHNDEWFEWTGFNGEYFNNKKPGVESFQTVFPEHKF